MSEIAILFSINKF